MEAKLLRLWRRHLKSCAKRKKGRDWTACSCPIWCDGELKGERYRASLDTRDWQRAIRKLAALEDPRAPEVKSVEDAIAAFENHIHPLEAATQRKYKNVIAQLRAYCERAGIDDVMQITVERLDGYRASRKLSSTTSTKELQTLRQFFGFCLERRWVDENPAKKIKLPRNVKPSEIVPYTPTEIGKIVAACDAIGQSAYERLRARAMVLLLRYTALRVSDVATLERDRVSGGQVLLHTQKTGGTVFLPVAEELERALEALPSPEGAGDEPHYFFWNGITSKRAMVGIAERTLASVFRRSKVEGAKAHRFRHTLATEILARGYTEQDVADILAISPAVVRKHYAKWSQARQKRISELFENVFAGEKRTEFGTRMARDHNQNIKSFKIN